MIIKRQYEILGMVVKRDTKAQKIAEQVCKDLDSELCEAIFSPYISLTLYNAGMGCGLPGEMFSKLLEEFNRLDETDPYDNGLTYRDVTSIEYETSRKGSAIRLIMKSNKAEQAERIVKVIAVDDQTVIKDWGFRKPLM